MSRVLGWFVNHEIERKMEDIEDKALNAYLSAISPKSALVSAPNVGAAESCRRLDRYSINQRKWSTWDDKQKEVATDLVGYNREDCRATASIMRKLLASRP